ncbi:class I SAM-dependent methyltransferase [bacterium (Candidatus Howlettbacteria) CG_4_10_14_3_um_filter_37_10]|nr:MAG: class I SAM-dependent methyltransferase [bacterium (Candidatus Howlettbacteria) CG_4_10_14_3_um_filter_37_10]
MAYNMGAKEVVSVDIDQFSIKCVQQLWIRENKPKNWKIITGSVLDKNFIKSLGQFDVVYSWGVLHHTGDMYRAFGNVINLVKNNGLMFLAIYNKCHGKNAILAGSSRFWLRVKRKYNNSGNIGKKIIEFLYYVYFFLGFFILLKNPFKYIKNYGERGMSFYYDIIDWLGGYPYEFATGDELINYFSKKSFLTKKVKFTDNTGCNELLFLKK